MPNVYPALTADVPPGSEHSALCWVGVFDDLETRLEMAEIAGIERCGEDLLVRGRK